MAAPLMVTIHSETIRHRITTLAVIEVEHNGPEQSDPETQTRTITRVSERQPPSNQHFYTKSSKL